MKNSPGNASRASRGFVFTAAVVLLLTFMIAVITLWLVSVRDSDRLEPEDARLLLFTSIMRQIDLGSLMQVFNSSSYYAMHKVNQQAAITPFQNAGNATLAMEQLAIYGTSNAPLSV